MQEYRNTTHHFKKCGRIPKQSFIISVLFFCAFTVVVLCIGDKAIAEGDTGVIFGAYAIEAIADISTHAFSAVDDGSGGFAFELRASRTIEHTASNKIAPQDALNDSLRALDPQFRNGAVVFTIADSDFPDLKDVGVKNPYPPQRGKCFAIPTNDVDVWGRARRGYQAVDYTGRVVLTQKALLDIASDRFKLTVSPKRLFYSPGRSAYYLKSRPDLVWYDYIPTAADLPSDMQNQMDKPELSNEIVEVPLYLEPRLFFAESSFRVPLINMLQKGDGPRRYYAATRLRLFNDAEVLSLLEDVSLDGLVGEAVAAKGEIVNCTRPSVSKNASTEDVKVAATKSLDYLVTGAATKNEILTGWGRLAKTNVFDLDVESLESDWQNQRQSNKPIVGSLVAYIVGSLLITSVAMFCYRCFSKGIVGAKSSLQAKS